MPIQTSTLRPGLLVSLKTSVTGNVAYDKQELVPRHLDEAGRQKKKWQTERIITDPAEMEKAWAVQQRARSLVTAVCASSAFGLLCPEADAEKLNGAIREARNLAEDFNSDASLTQLRIYVMIGRIASDDVEAVQAISSEVRGLLDDMTTGIENLDVQVIRKAATRAKSVGAMLSSEASEQVLGAVEAARTIAKKIRKAGETVTAEIDQDLLRQITEARTAFLDMEDSEEITAPEAEQGRTVELTPLEEAIEATREAPSRYRPVTGDQVTRGGTPRRR